MLKLLSISMLFIGVLSVFRLRHSVLYRLLMLLEFTMFLLIYSLYSFYRIEEE